MNENGSHSNGALKYVVPPLETVEWRNGGLEILDQTWLPLWREVRRITSVEAAVDALQRLVVRGAPAIGVFAGFAMVVGFDEAAPRSPAEAEDVLMRLEDEIGNARRTAISLRWAVSRVAAAARRGNDVAGMRAAALAEASAIQAQDRASCRRIAKHGLVELAGVSRILTHCNAGRLASTGIGTALAPIYAKFEAGQTVEVVSCETRPLFQGGRLTAWELGEAGVPVTLIIDGAAGAAISTGIIEAVIVGCDRVAMNGDTVNKIGTCGLAVCAYDEGIPFYVAGPLSSFDPDSPDGEEMPIEHRDDDEVLRIGVSQVNADVSVWNPAFDMTTAKYITAFITDAGVLRPPFRDSIAAALAAGGDAAP